MEILIVFGIYACVFFAGMLTDAVLLAMLMMRQIRKNMETDMQTLSDLAKYLSKPLPGDEWKKGTKQCFWDCLRHDAYSCMFKCTCHNLKRKEKK